MPHKKRKGKTWKKIEVNSMEHIGEILNVRCCCDGRRIKGAAMVARDTILGYFGKELAIKSHA